MYTEWINFSFPGDFIFLVTIELDVYLLVFWDINKALVNLER
jgi:hypothetical protein